MLNEILRKAIDSFQKRPQGSSKEFLEMIIIMEVVKLINYQH